MAASLATSHALASSSQAAEVNFSSVAHREAELNDDDGIRSESSRKSWNGSAKHSSPSPSAKVSLAGAKAVDRRTVSEGKHRDGQTDHKKSHHKNRSSGGFLLDGSMRKKRRVESGPVTSRPTSSSKGKGRADAVPVDETPWPNGTNGVNHLESELTNSSGPTSGHHTRSYGPRWCQ